MSAADVLDLAREIGHRVTLKPDGGLALLGDRGPHTEELLGLLRPMRDEVKAELEARARFVDEADWSEGERYLITMLDAGAWQPAPLRGWKW